MSWFNKNKKEEGGEERQEFNLPELPKLPELPDLDEERRNSREKLPRLPSFPNNKLGQRFSQDAIKDAVTGKKGDNEGFANDFNENLDRHFPHQKIRTKEIDEETRNSKKKMNNHNNNSNNHNNMISREPIFIRIDKFEDGMNTFKKTKTKISEIEEMLKDIRSLKNQEEKELGEWEAEIQSIKSQIQKIDSDVFSKIE